MIVFGVVGALVIGLAIGFLINVRMVAKQVIGDKLTAAGLTKDAAKRYREAAKILHDLVYISDLEELIPTLPSPMQRRIENWLKAHKEAATHGKP